MNSALEIKHLDYAYKGNWSFSRTPCLHDINLQVFEGESFGFLGQSGAGKTTSIKCILSLLQPTGGSIEIFGRPAKETAARAGIGYLPEQPYFYDHLSVGETVSMYACLSGVSSADLKHAVNTAITRVGLSHKKDAALRTLSKGLTQRVAMAQAIAAKPKLLILDEPFSGLDPLGRREISDLLFELKDEGTTIFMSSHILSDVESVCDRVSIMKDGRLQGIFEIANIPEKFSSAKYELVINNVGSSVEALIAKSCSHSQQGSLLRLSYSEETRALEMLEHALSSKLKIEKFTFSRPSLEEIFVQIVKDGDAEL